MKVKEQRGREKEERTGQTQTPTIVLGGKGEHNFSFPSRLSYPEQAERRGGGGKETPPLTGKKKGEGKPRRGCSRCICPTDCGRKRGGLGKRREKDWRWYVQALPPVFIYHQGAAVEKRKKKGKNRACPGFTSRKRGILLSLSIL